MELDDEVENKAVRSGVEIDVGSWREASSTRSSKDFENAKSRD